MMNNETIKVWYKKYGPMIFRRCNQLLNDESAAKDAMQEVFVQVLRSREQIRDEYPASFLYRAATNTSLNIIRSRKRHNETFSSDTVLELIADEDNSYQHVALKSLLSRIFKHEPVSTRVMAVTHFVDGLTLEETAREMNMSVSGVRKRLRLLQERIKTAGFSELVELAEPAKRTVWKRN